jgi:glucose/arabinose dehydrogenase
MLADRARLFVLFLYTLLVAGCGGHDGGIFGRGHDGGRLAVVIAAPAGVQLAAAVRVTGPGGFARDLARSDELKDLAPGDYLVAAAEVRVGSTTYVPSPASQTISIARDRHGAVIANVSYTTRTSAPVLALARVASGLDSPVYLTAPDHDQRRFIVLRAGRIVVQDDGGVQAQAFLDISARVATVGDGGLLSLAFDPRFASNGYFYVFYTDAQQDMVVERFHAAPGADRADSGQGLVILRVPHQVDNAHYGGQLAFDADGYLYVSTGDGGDGSAASGNARDPANLLGKILRLDVSHASAGQPYAIPASNPYAGQQGKRGEVWASGLRNPWRISIDNDQLYIADVGESQREELNVAGAAKGGLDFGWNTMEGSLCLKDGCDRTGITGPAFEYPHSAPPGEACAIVGGFVYRGSALPELAGRYFYSDYCGGFLKSLYVDGGAVLEQHDWLPGSGHVTSMGRDGMGELYLILENGSIYKIGRAASKG